MLSTSFLLAVVPIIGKVFIVALAFGILRGCLRRVLSASVHARRARADYFEPSKEDGGWKAMAWRNCNDAPGT